MSLSSHVGAGEISEAHESGPASETVHVQCKEVGGAPLKVVRLRPDVTDPAIVQLFNDRAAIAARVDHPAIARVAAVFENAVVMEDFRGSTLAGVVSRAERRDADVPLWFVLDVAAELSDALASAHHKACVHGCLSPDLIRFGDRAEAKIADFGVAPWIDLATELKDNMGRAEVGYIAPEILRGSRPDSSADVFSLGVILWEMITGRRLFHAPNTLEIARLVISVPRVAPSTMNPEIPADLDGLILAALDVDKNKRPSMREMHALFALARDERAAYAADETTGSIRIEAVEIESIASDGHVIAAQDAHTLIARWRQEEKPACVRGSRGEPLDAESFLRLAGVEDLIDDARAILNPVERGDFRQRSLVGLLSDLSRERFTGRLAIIDGNVRCDVDFLEGAPVYVTSADPELRLPDLAIRRGLMREEEVDRILSEVVRRGVTLRTVLSERRPEDTAELWPSMMLDRLQAAFRWRNARWILDAGAAMNEARPFAASTAGLVFGGTRRMIGVETLGRWADAMSNLVVLISAEDFEPIADAFDLPAAWMPALDRIRRGGTIGELINAAPERATPTLLLLYVLVECGAIALREMALREVTPRRLELRSAA